MDRISTAETLSVGGRNIASPRSPPRRAPAQRLARLPFSLRILLENLLRREGEPG